MLYQLPEKMYSWQRVEPRHNRQFARTLEEYNPLSREDVKFIEDPSLPLYVDVNDFRPIDPEYIFHSAANSLGSVVITNVFHRKYPYAFCQVQINFLPKEPKAFIVQASEKEEQIPQEEINRILQNELLPAVQQELQADVYDMLSGIMSIIDEDYGDTAEELNIVH